MIFKNMQDIAKGKLIDQHTYDKKDGRFKINDLTFHFNKCQI